MKDKLAMTSRGALVFLALCFLLLFVSRAELQEKTTKVKVTTNPEYSPSFISQGEQEKGGHQPRNPADYRPLPLPEWKPPKQIVQKGDQLVKYDIKTYPNNSFINTKTF